MGLVAGRGLEGGGLDFVETVRGEPPPHEVGDEHPRHEPAAALRMTLAAPERGGGGRDSNASRGSWAPAAAVPAGLRRQNHYIAPLNRQAAACKEALLAQKRRTPDFEEKDVRVIASSIRKGNIIEREDGQLCVVLSAESFHPGKGTPTTQIDMRRLSDGVKVTDRFKTTEQVERAFVEDKNFDFLYADGDGYHFMNADTFDQLTVPAEVIGDQAQWLQEGMKVILSIFNETPVAIQLPPRVTLEVVETEPAMKGQTASSSYKPAKLSNGARAWCRRTSARARASSCRPRTAATSSARRTERRRVPPAAASVTAYPVNFDRIGAPSGTTGENSRASARAAAKAGRALSDFR